MNIASCLGFLNKAFLSGSLMCFLLLSAMPAQASFTSAQLTDLVTNDGGGQTLITGSEGTIELVAVSTTRAAVGLELTSAQAVGVQSTSFWGTLVSKFKFANVASRAAGGCFAGTIAGGLASRSQHTVAMKALRVVAGCASGLLAAPVAEFASAMVLAMGAPVWAGVGATVLVTGIIVAGAAYGMEKLWFEKAAANRQLIVIDGKYQAPLGIEIGSMTVDYVSVGDEINSRRKLGKNSVQGLDIVDLDPRLDLSGSGAFIDVLGNSSGIRANCAYISQGWACLQ